MLMMRIKIPVLSHKLTVPYLMMLCWQKLALIFYFSFSTPNFVARPEDCFEEVIL